jgi:inosine/xanthosine triphosphate pyrophosphatase family protein
MQLVIGTTNTAKFERYRTILAWFGDWEIVPLNAFTSLPAIAEDGLTAAENARQKATAYATALNLPVFSIDESLIIPALPKEQQPGVNVRRYLGRTATDEQLLAAYQEIARQLPENQRFTVWTYAFNLAFPDGQDFSAQVELTKKLLTQPSLPILSGYPLSSIQADLQTGKALRDLSANEVRTHLAEVYRAVSELLQQAGLNN